MTSTPLQTTMASEYHSGWMPCLRITAAVTPFDTGVTRRPLSWAPLKAVARLPQVAMLQDAIVTLLEQRQDWKIDKPMNKCA
mmetsp:Transcript_23412/g.51396  ORF Transcript_23412/g.51396 Transcript_23412/m.51396 type:complete len:82 (-) Transcript_23412:7-252(-)